MGFKKFSIDQLKDQQLQIKFPMNPETLKEEEARGKEIPKTQCSHCGHWETHPCSIDTEWIDARECIATKQ